MAKDKTATTPKVVPLMVGVRIIAGSVQKYKSTTAYYSIGDEVSVPDKTAQNLVAHGFAEYLPVVATEQATQ